MMANLADSIIRTVVTNIEGGFGSRLRYEYYKRKLKRCDGYFTTGAGFRMDGCGNISIGRLCSFNAGVWINSSCKLVIGDYVIVGPYSIIRDANHGYSVVEEQMRFQ
jgi:acetyltransferase-like isoleucine patch superfamily enzyme